MAWMKLKSDVDNVGLIGVGTMGRCMLQKLIGAGYKTVALDHLPAAQQFAGQLGARVAGSLKEVAESSDIVIMSLPGPDQIEAVMLGDHGLAQYLKQGQVVVDTSTVDPDTSKKMAMEAEAIGVAYLDAPILGRPSAVGCWLLPVGGDAGALEYCKSALLTFAGKAVMVGPPGSGNVLKLLNQLMFSTINCVTSEVLAIANRMGIDPNVVYDTISNSGAATVSGLFCEVAKKIVEEDYDNPVFTIDLLCKDAGLAIEMAKNSGAPAIIAGLVQTFNELAKSIGLGREDTSALYKMYGELFKSHILH